MIRRPFLFAASLLMGVAAASAQPPKAGDLDRLRTRIGDLQQQLERDQGERDALAAELQKTERAAAELARTVASLRAKRDAQDRRIHELESEQAQAHKALERSLEALRQQVRAAYLIGRNGKTQLLLSLDDAQQVGRVLVYYDYLQRAQTRGIQAINSRSAELEALTERLIQERETLDATRKEQEAALKSLREERGKRAEVLKQIRQRIADGSGEIKRLQDDERALRRLIESVRDNLADLPPDAAFSDKPFATLKGKLPWPVRGKMLARFGEAKAGGRLTWNGHWIAATEGTAVRAVARGRVAYVGWMHRYGLIVLIEHEGGYYTLYGHAQAARVAIGDAIKAGQVIATAGSTGGHDRNGVYFELRKGTEPINPKVWLAR
jgi:septal ring factor EnvC (AmiA/AmiB activator)